MKDAYFLDFITGEARGAMKERRGEKKEVFFVLLFLKIKI